MASSSPLQEQTQLETLFEEIMNLMASFEELKPKFSVLPPQQALQPAVSPEDFALLSGQASEILHRRFLALQSRTQTLRAGDEAMITPEVQQFAHDLRKHIDDVRRVLAVRTR